MGQKVNPNIFQLSKNDKWPSKYLEKSSIEFSLYTKKDKEIRNFIHRFFRTYHIILHNCKIYYFNKSLHILISYYPIIKKTKVIKLKHSDIKQQSFERDFGVFERVKTIFFLKQLFDSLTSFIGERTKLFLVLKELRFYTNYITKEKRIRNRIKKNLTPLRRYQESLFFNEGVTLLFNCVIHRESSKLLAQFIAVQLKNLKRHNFFIRFIAHTLKLLKKNSLSKSKGIKIEINGRINGRPRARSKIVKISNTVSVLTIDSIINYSEKISFTRKGAFGIKVWIHELGY